MGITRNLPDGPYKAATGANSPSAANPFATVDDLSSVGGANTFVVTVGTGGQSIFNVGYDLKPGFQCLLNGVVNEGITANATITGTQQLTTAVLIDEFVVFRVNN